MNIDIKEILQGDAFRTGSGIAQIIGRQSSISDPDDDVLLLQVARLPGQTFRAFTTVQALALNLETGRWTALRDDERLAA